jgi:curved DNA-binding protein CbpA
MASTSHNLEIILDNFDLYSILDLEPGENNQSIIRKAYYRKSLEFHPDKNKSNDQKFYIIGLAYKILSHPENKKKYDLEYFDKTDKNRNKLTEKETSLMDLKYSDYPIIISDDSMNKLVGDFTKFSKEIIAEHKSSEKKPKSILKNANSSPDTERLNAVKAFMSANGLQGDPVEWLKKLELNPKKEEEPQDKEVDFKEIIKQKRENEKQKLEELASNYESEKVTDRLSRYRKFDGEISKTLSEQPKLLKSFNLNEFNIMFEKVKEESIKNGVEDETTFLSLPTKNTNNQLIAYNASTNGFSSFYAIKNDTYVEPEIESNIPKGNVNHNMFLRNIDYGVIRSDNRQLVNSKDPIRNTSHTLNNYSTERNKDTNIVRDGGALNKIRYGFDDPTNSELFR